MLPSVNSQCIIFITHTSLSSLLVCEKRTDYRLINNEWQPVKVIELFGDLYWEIKHEIELYRTLYCLHICLAMCSVLPRELRDIIYSLLLPDSKYEFDRESPMRRRYPWQRAGEPLYWFWTESHLGQQSLVELTELWYRNTIFDVGDQCKPILSYKPFPTSPIVLNPEKLVSNVRVTVSRYARDNRLHECTLQKLEGLLELKVGARITLLLHNGKLPQYVDDRGRMRHQYLGIHKRRSTDLKILYPLLHRLRERGCRLWIYLPPEGKTVTYERFLAAYCYNPKSLSKTWPFPSEASSMYQLFPGDESQGQHATPS